MPDEYAIHDERAARRLWLGIQKLITEVLTPQGKDIKSYINMEDMPAGYGKPYEHMPPRDMKRGGGGGCRINRNKPSDSPSWRRQIINPRADRIRGEQIEGDSSGSSDGPGHAERSNSSSPATYSNHSSRGPSPIVVDRDLPDFKALYEHANFSSTPNPTPIKPSSRVPTSPTFRVPTGSIEGKNQNVQTSVDRMPMLETNGSVESHSH